jgi:hypothetical protein
LERENAEDDTIGYVVPASSPLILPTPLHIPDSSRRHRLLLQIEEEVFFRQDRGGSAASGGSAPSGGSETCTGRWSGVDGNNRSIFVFSTHSEMRYEDNAFNRTTYEEVHHTTNSIRLG